MITLEDRLALALSGLTGWAEGCALATGKNTDDIYWIRAAVRVLEEWLSRKSTMDGLSSDEKAVKRSRIHLEDHILNALQSGPLSRQAILDELSMRGVFYGYAGSPSRVLNLTLHNLTKTGTLLKSGDLYRYFMGAENDPQTL